MNTPEEKTPTQSIRSSLEAYLASSGVAMSEFAKSVGYDKSAISKYLAGKPEGNVPRLEACIADGLRNAKRREEIRVDLTDTDVSREINIAAELIRKTNDVGVVDGPAGAGKSCGIQLYSRANRTAVVITASSFRKNAKGLERAILDQVSTAGMNQSANRAEWLVERFKGTNRLIIVDNAQRLNNDALNFIFDFHDETDCGFLLVGNPRIIEMVRKVDQHFSRVGYYKRVGLKEIDALAVKLVQQLFPEGAAEIMELALKVIAHDGHGRALRKQCILAREIHLQGNMAPRKAFAAAHQRLVRNYKLED